MMMDPMAYNGRGMAMGNRRGGMGPGPMGPMAMPGTASRARLPRL